MKLTPEQEQRLFLIAAASPDGVLRVDDVIEDARHPDSPLHSLYDWDVEKAAMEHWRERTREIIQSVRVTVEVRKTVVSAVAYVRDPEINGRMQGYASTLMVARSAQKSDMAIEAEFARLDGLLDRLRGLAQVFGRSVDAVDDLIQAARRARKLLLKS